MMVYPQQFQDPFWRLRALHPLAFCKSVSISLSFGKTRKRLFALNFLSEKQSILRPAYALPNDIRRVK